MRLTYYLTDKLQLILYIIFSIVAISDVIDNSKLVFIIGCISIIILSFILFFSDSEVPFFEKLFRTTFIVSSLCYFIFKICHWNGWLIWLWISLFFVFIYLVIFITVLVIKYKIIMKKLSNNLFILVLSIVIVNNSILKDVFGYHNKGDYTITPTNTNHGEIYKYEILYEINSYDKELLQAKVSFLSKNNNESNIVKSHLMSELIKIDNSLIQLTEDSLFHHYIAFQEKKILKSLNVPLSSEEFDSMRIYSKKVLDNYIIKMEIHIQ